MRKYVVYVQRDLEGDDCGPYTGIEHDDMWDAERERDRALDDDNIWHAWIREEVPLREVEEWTE